MLHAQQIESCTHTKTNQKQRPNYSGVQLTVCQKDAKGRLPFIVWKQTAVKRISSGQQLDHLLFPLDHRPRPTEDIGKRDVIVIHLLSCI